MITRQTLTQLVVGMQVYDNGGARIGTVSAIYLGKKIKASKTNNAALAVKTISDLLEKRKDLSVHLCLKLYNEGFIYVEGCPLQQDLIVSPSDIEKIDTDNIYLKLKLVYRRKLKLTKADTRIKNSQATKSPARTI